MWVATQPNPFDLCAQRTATGEPGQDGELEGADHLAVHLGDDEQLGGSPAIRAKAAS